MLQIFELAAAVRALYTTGIEFSQESFVELSGEKLDAYRRKVGPVKGRLYEVVVMEPTVIDRVGNEKVTLEITIVSERDRENLLKAVKFVYETTHEMTGSEIRFSDRLDWLRPRLPDVIVGEEPKI